MYGFAPSAAGSRNIQTPSGATGEPDSSGGGFCSVASRVWMSAVDGGVGGNRTRGYTVKLVWQTDVAVSRTAVFNDSLRLSATGS
jgi:hypothetical protein